MKALIRATACLALLLLCLATAGAASNYTCTNLGREWAPNALNNSGQIVGCGTPAPDDLNVYACLWQHGTITYLVGGELGSQALGINAPITLGAWHSGQIVGYFTTPSGPRHPCLWQADGTITDLGTLPGAVDDGWANGINNSGQIVGCSKAPSGSYHACLWQDGTITDLGTLPGGVLSEALGINDSGQIVGWSDMTKDVDVHACLWQDGTITDLGMLPGGSLSEALGINNSGQIVGWSNHEDSYTKVFIHACLWQDGAITDLGTLPAPISSSWATDINNSGRIVGQSYNNACLWQDGTITDLGVSFDLSWTTGINDNGQIVGRGYTTTGGYQACLWEPTADFWDVPVGFWAFDQIRAALRAGIVQGYPDGSYQPTLPVTRDQMAVYIARALAGGDSNVPDFTGTPTFPDVPDTFWALKYVEFAVDEGVVTGYEDGNYQPAISVTRDQMAVYIARSTVAPTGEAALADYTPADPRNFPDVASDFWAWKHIEYCVENSVVNGYEDGLYHPEVVVTRDQMAVYVARAFDLPM